MGFDYTFMYPSDEVYVAYTVPYTVTQLNSHIKQLRLLSDESRKYHRTTPYIRYAPNFLLCSPYHKAACSPYVAHFIQYRL